MEKQGELLQRILKDILCSYLACKETELDFIHSFSYSVTTTMQSYTQEKQNTEQDIIKSVYSFLFLVLCCCLQDSPLCIFIRSIVWEFLFCFILLLLLHTYLLFLLVWATLPKHYYYYYYYINIIVYVRVERGVVGNSRASVLLNRPTLEAESFHSGYLPLLSVTAGSEVNTCHPCYSLQHLQKKL